MTAACPLFRFAAVVSIALALPGCGEMSDSSRSSGNDDQVSLLELRLAQAVLGFQNAEESFGPSTSGDELVKNAHWLDRMAAEYRKVESVEREVVALGGSPLTELKNELAARFRRHLATLESDSKYVGTMHQLEMARIWSEI